MGAAELTLGKNARSDRDGNPYDPQWMNQSRLKRNDRCVRKMLIFKNFLKL